MRAFRFVEHVDRPPGDVWDVLVDLQQAFRWRPLVKAMETLDGRPVHAGSVVRITHEFFGRSGTTVSRTVEFEPGRRWVLRSAARPEGMEGWFEFIVEPEGNGTRVIATCELKAHRFLTRLHLPLIARSERKRRTEMLGNLKRLVEGHEGSDSGSDS
jgi:uncharacterized protein YndB with AHSA1/START domain